MSSHTFPCQRFVLKRHSVSQSTFVLYGMLICVVIAGCSDEGANQSSKGAQSNDPPVRVAPADTSEAELTAAELRARLKAKNPNMNDTNIQIIKAGGEIRMVRLPQSGVTDISPLEGLPLRFLDLGFLPITDISVLKGMPLETLDLENTKVSDISVLEKMPLRILRLQNTDVSDISVLEGMELRKLNLLGTKIEDITVVKTLPLKSLWIPSTKVVDLSPLEGKYLESLDIQDTSISDLSVVAEMTSLRRLNIVDSQVTDLSVLKNLRLDRLLFTPHRIERGIEVARSMSSLREMGTSFEGRTKPEDFWESYDAGKFKDEAE